MIFNGINYTVSQVNGQLICMDVNGQVPDTSEVSFFKFYYNFKRFLVFRKLLRFPRP